MNYFQFHIGDYASATIHLSLIEDAVYQRLLRKYYLEERALPHDVAQCSRLVGARSEDEQKAVHAVLHDFFKLDEERGWVNSRADAEIEAYHAMAERNRANGAKGGRPRREPAPEAPTEPTTTPPKPAAPSADQNPVGSESKPKSKATKNQEPRTINQEPSPTTVGEVQEGGKPPPAAQQAAKRSSVKSAFAPAEKPESVTDGVWADFMALRRHLKAPLTATALAGIVREAQQAAWPLEDALRECCARGWRGFKAEWVRKPQSASGRAPSYSDRMAAVVANLTGPIVAGNVIDV